MWRLPPLVFFPASYPRESFPTVSEPLTDWESTIPAEALGSRLAAFRTSARSASWILSLVPSAFHRWKYQYTVSQSGESCGSIRQAHPVRSR